jgi:hypothetical protein
MPANLDDVLANHVVAGVLEGLRKRADVVLVDSTPLVSGDAVALSAAVDALLVVVRMDLFRRPMLRELRRVLDTIPTRKIGFVAAGLDSGAGYSGHDTYDRRPAPRTQEPVA